MAKRTNRQLIRDRLEQAAKFVDDADTKLDQAQSVYYEQGEMRGAELSMIRTGCAMLAETIRQFRARRS